MYMRNPLHRSGHETATPGRTDIHKMEPGESTWTWPIAIEIIDGKVMLNEGFVSRGHLYRATLPLKVVKGPNGIVLDATAMTPMDLAEFIGETTNPTGELKSAVAKVLYPDTPLIPDFDNTPILEYNDAQRQIREEFRRDYRDAFGIPYITASTQAGIGASALS